MGAFERVGNRPNSSPTEAVIQDFITRGFTVDQLYTMLTEIGHIEGRRVLKDYGRLDGFMAKCVIYVKEFMGF